MRKNSKVLKSFTETSHEISLLSGGKRERAERLFEKAAFMDAQMIKLQKILAKKGWTEDYQNGANQKGLKKSSEADVYLALSKNYMAIMKQLNDMFSSSPITSTSDPLDEYI